MIKMGKILNTFLEKRHEQTLNIVKRTYAMKTISCPAHTDWNGSLGDWPSQAKKQRNWKLSFTARGWGGGLKLSELL